MGTTLAGTLLLSFQVPEIHISTVLLPGLKVGGAVKFRIGLSIGTVGARGDGKEAGAGMLITDDC